MSVKATHAVWEHSDAVGTNKLILLALADHVNAEGLCWPSVARVAHMARVDRATVYRAFNDLEKAGDLKRIGRGGGRGKPNVYEVMPAVVDNSEKGSQIATQSPVKGRISQLKGRTLGTNKGSHWCDTEPNSNRKEPRADFVSGIPDDWDPDIAARVSEIRARLSHPTNGQNDEPV